MTLAQKVETAGLQVHGGGAVVPLPSGGPHTRPRHQPPAAQKSPGGYYTVPNAVVWQWQAELSAKALQALHYILACTHGGRYVKPIPYAQFMTGRPGRDRGCGIKNRSTLKTALQELEDLGIVRVERNNNYMGQQVSTYTVLPALYGATVASPILAPPSPFPGPPSPILDPPSTGNGLACESDPRPPQSVKRTRMDREEPDHEELSNNNNNTGMEREVDAGGRVVVVQGVFEGDAELPLDDAQLTATWTGYSGTSSNALPESTERPGARRVDDEARELREDPDGARTLARIAEVGVTLQAAVDLLKDCGAERILNVLDTHDVMGKNNPAGYLIRAVRENWPAPPHVVKVREAAQACERERAERADRAEIQRREVQERLEIQRRLQEVWDGLEDDERAALEEQAREELRDDCPDTIDARTGEPREVFVKARVREIIAQRFGLAPAGESP